MSELIKNRQKVLSFAVQLAVIFALLTVLYFPVMALLGRMYFRGPRYQHYSHGVLLPLVSLAYILKKRHLLWQTESEPSYLFGLLTIFFALMLRGWGIIAAVNFFERLSLVVLLAGIILFLMGRRMLKELLFPVGYLLLAFPLPLGLDLGVIRPLQRLTSAISAIWLEMMGVPLVREGNVLILPGINPPLFVDRACSGISALIALFTLALGFVFLVERRNWHKVIMVVATIPIAIGVNLVRVTLTGLLAYHQGAAAAKGFYHALSDLSLFALGLVLLLLLDLVLSKLGTGSARQAQAKSS